MYCTHCGSQVDGTHCSVCGQATSATLAAEKAALPTELATWGQRAGATVVDNVVLLLPSILVGVGATTFAGNYIGAITILVFQGMYFTRMLSTKEGQTIGNRVAKTRVVDAITGVVPTRQQAFRRWLPFALCQALGIVASFILFPLAILFAADYLLPLFDKQNQTLHDKFAGTIVLKVI
jgi:uncharacterized RDD family membrane protein YckC